jgi:hypothetical protein
MKGSCAVGLLWLLTAAVRPCPAQNQAQTVPTATLELRKAVASSAGIRATVSLTHAKVLFLKIEAQNSGTGNYDQPYIPWMFVPLPSVLQDTPNPVVEDILIPVVIPGDTSKHFQMFLYTSAAVDANGASSVYTVSSPYPLDGYSPALTKAFTLKFNQQTLTVSAQTAAIVNMTVSWVVEDTSGTKRSVGMSAMNNHQDPSVDLQYSDLGAANPSSLPSIDVKLTDPNTQESQEAVFAVAIAASQDLKTKAKTAQPTDKKNTLSWSDILKTGLGALLKYFVPA